MRPAATLTTVPNQTLSALFSDQTTTVASTCPIYFYGPYLNSCTTPLTQTHTTYQIALFVLAFTKPTSQKNKSSYFHCRSDAHFWLLHRIITMEVDRTVETANEASKTVECNPDGENLGLASSFVVSTVKCSAGTMCGAKMC